jgi:hypothetical protein
MRRRRSIQEVGDGFIAWLVGQWKRLPASFRWNIEDTFQPEDIAERLLPGEEPELEIRLAWYRDIIGHFVFRYFMLLVLLTLAITALLVVWSISMGTLSLWWALLPPAAFLLLLFVAFQQRIHYLQWRLLKTSARLIISVPVEGANLPIVDNIELKGLPAVVDTNWSPNLFWRMFQFFTGARDLAISLQGYRFIEGTARVADSLTMPDVMPEDVFELKRLIFRVPGFPF